MKFGVLGSGFPLYFHLKMFTGVIYLCLIAIVGIPCFYFNSNQNRGGEWVDDGEIVLLARSTLGNHGKDPDYYHSNSDINVIVALNSAFIFLLFILSMLLKSRQDNIIRSVESDIVTPSDFTLMAYNLPLDKTPIELKDWLETNSWCSPIHSISYCYNISSIIGHI